MLAGIATRENSGVVPPGNSGGSQLLKWLLRLQRSIWQAPRRCRPQSARASYAAPPASSALGSSIPAISAMRTRSDKLAACILSIRLAR